MVACRCIGPTSLRIMPKVSDHFVVGVNAPPRWTVDIVGNVEWREDTTNLDTLSTLKSIAPEFAIPSVLDDRITPISIRVSVPIPTSFASVVDCQAQPSRRATDARSACGTSPRRSSGTTGASSLPGTRSHPASSWGNSASGWTRSWRRFSCRRQ